MQKERRGDESGAQGKNGAILTDAGSWLAECLQQATGATLTVATTRITTKGVWPIRPRGGSWKAER